MHKKLLLPLFVLLVAVPAIAETTFRCESIDGKYRECRATGDGNLFISKHLSDSRCVQGQTWGYRDGVIWVDNGCRADFQFTPLDQLNMFVLCESQDGKRSNCAADTAAGVRLARQISTSDCRFGRDWGYDANGIWVTNGCRGEFGVRSATAMISSSPGATITTTTPLPATIVCESQNNGRRHCRADTSNGISLVRQISQNECVRDRTWGVDRDGVWVTGGCRAEFTHGTDRNAAAIMPPAAPMSPVFVCESIDGKRNHCALDTSYGVNLLRQISDSNCVLNQTWGVDANGIWVSGGCRGEFTLGNARIQLGDDVPASARVLCESIDGQRTVCPADTRMGVAVVKQISDSACRLNSTWGFDANGIWVTAGCRAEFTLRR